MVSRRFDKKPEKKGTMPKEQRARIGSEIYKPQVWHVKQIVDKGQPSANIQMAFLLPSEFRAPTDQEVYSDFNESEYEEIVAKLTVIQQAIFDNQSSIST